MAIFNYAAREMTAKIVYYGPGLSGKTTSIQYIHTKISPKKLTQFGASASAVLLMASLAFAAPQAHAAKNFYRCNGAGTVTIKYDGKDYWFIQNGKVCGRRAA